MRDEDIVHAPMKIGGENMNKARVAEAARGLFQIEHVSDFGFGRIEKLTVSIFNASIEH